MPNLARIAELYRIESEIHGRLAEERRDIRQARSRAIIDALEPWLKAKLALISQKSKLEGSKNCSLLSACRFSGLPGRFEWRGIWPARPAWALTAVIHPR